MCQQLKLTQYSNPRYPMHGVAIVSVLVIVAIVAIIATQISVYQQQFIGRATNMLEHQRQLLLALSIEAWAENLLTVDLEKSLNNPNHQIDTLRDNWFNELDSSRVGDADLSGEIIDLQAKINLNNLNHNDNIYIAQMNLLFNKLDIDPILIDALRDYLDKNDQIYSNESAENSYYTRLDKPYKIANQAMVGLSELRLIKGFTQAIVNQLTPWVWVGPKAVNQVNINTSGKMILETLSDKIDEKLMTSIIKKQQEEGFLSVDEFLNLVDKIGIDRKLLTVSSHYFLLKSQVDSPRSGLKMQTFLYRDKDKSTIIKTRRIIQ